MAVFGRVDGLYTAVYTALVHVDTDTCTRPYTCRVHGRVHGPYMAIYTSRVRGRVRAMYTAEDVRTEAPTQSCTRVVQSGRVHGPYTAVYVPCIGHGRYT